ncbi:MAG: PA2778 family cysteine peptidase [Gammaproteobacteria bacterium]
MMRFSVWSQVGAMVVVSSLAGCMAPQTAALRQDRVVSESVQVSDVPFFAQEDYQCGPAALAMMLSWSGKPVAPDALVKDVYVPGRKGSFAVEMAAAARRHGRLMYPLAPDLGSVVAALEQGYPVLVLQNNGLAVYPVWHFAVVTGVDRARERLWLNSGRTKGLEISFSTFERTWARGGYWASLVLDPAAVTESLDAPVVIRELAIMDGVGAVKEAQAGFARALITWPEQKTAWLGLASTSMKLGDLALAESTLRELVRRQPQYGAGLNNLADLLLRTDRPLEALPFAERAVGFLDIPATRATLAAAQAAVAAKDEPEVPAASGQ